MSVNQFSGWRRGLPQSWPQLSSADQQPAAGAIQPQVGPDPLALLLYPLSGMGEAAGLIPMLPDAAKRKPKEEEEDDEDKDKEKEEKEEEPDDVPAADDDDEEEDEDDAEDVEEDFEDDEDFEDSTTTSNA
ncbi:MAG: hypothetical protein ABSH22_17750 [Tepidisphaeraceae bacterium]